jgi:mono/diheme cytochrome c family protein
MTILKISSIAVAALIIVACNSTKKTTTSTTPVVTTPAPAPVKAATGIFEPGNDQLVAIQVKHPDATLAVLTEGHSLYTGTCTNCHGAKSIYRIPEEKWQGIIDNMSHKAKLTDVQKDALSKYVFSIKATQPK